MGTLALSWTVAAVAALVAAVSVVRVATTGGDARFAAGAELLMGLCMAVMALPATAAWYGGYGMWWAVAFGLLTLGGIALMVKHTRRAGWEHGRHWVHLVVGSAGMVIMTLAMTSTSSGPVLALGSSSMAGMPGMANMTNAASTTGTDQMAGMGSMQGMGSMPGTSMPGTAATATDTSALWLSPSAWRLMFVALGVYFLLSIGASVWARIRGTERRTGGGTVWSRWLLAMPDAVVVFLASLTLSVWDKSRMAQRPGRGRRRKLGAAPDAALAAHLGMGGTMAAMLMMMAA